MPDRYTHERLLGRAASKLWRELPRDLQEQLFTAATRHDPRLRTSLAMFLHECRRQVGGPKAVVPQ